MKPKQIPLSIRLWLISLGIFGGIVTSSLLITIGYFAYGSFVIGSLLVALAIIGSMLCIWVISWRCRRTLEEWGLIEPKKEKKQ